MYETSDFLKFVIRLLYFCGRNNLLTNKKLKFMMKIKKLLLYLLFVPIMFVTLISGDCDNDPGEKLGMYIKAYLSPLFGSGNRCGGGAGQYEWQ